VSGFSGFPCLVAAAVLFASSSQSTLFSVFVNPLT